jgi:hypothetical protein
MDHCHSGKVETVSNGQMHPTMLLLKHSLGCNVQCHAEGFSGRYTATGCKCDTGSADPAVSQLGAISLPVNIFLDMQGLAR